MCNLASISLSKCIKFVDFDPEISVMIYSINNCNWCKLAKNLLIKNNIQFTHIDCSDWGEDSINQVKNNMNYKTFPMIRIGGERDTIGYAELKKRLQPSFDYEKLEKNTRTLTRNLN